MSVEATNCLARIRELLWMLPHTVLASHQREYEALFRNATNIATAAPIVPTGANGTAKCLPLVARLRSTTAAATAAA